MKSGHSPNTSCIDTIKALLSSKLARAFKWQYASNLGVGLIGALYLVVAGRVLGASDFGMYALAVSIPTLVQGLLDCRFQEVVIHFDAHGNKHEKSEIGKNIASLYPLDFALKAVSFVVSLLVSFVVNYFSIFLIDIEIMIISSVMLYLSKLTYSTSMGILRVNDRLDVFVKIQLSDWIVRIAALLALILAGKASVEAILISQLIVAIVHNILLARSGVVAFRQRYGLGLKEAAHGWGAVISKNRGYLFSNQIISATDYVTKEIDVIIVGIFLDLSQVGVYRMAKNLASAAWRLADPVYIVIMPKLSSLYIDGDGPGLTRLLKLMTTGLALFALVLFGSAWLGVWLLADLFLGASFAPSATIFPFIAGWVLVSMPLMWTHSLAVGSGHSAIQMRASLLGNGVGLAAILIGAWQFGLTGAAIGVSIAYALPFILSFILLRRRGIFSW